MRLFSFSALFLFLLYAIAVDRVLSLVGLKRRFPVRLRVNTQVIQNVTTPMVNNDNQEDGWLLEKYMQLPAAQYACVPMPLNSSLERVFGSEEEFILKVPQVSFKLPSGPIDVNPEVRAKVEVGPEKVVIKSLACTISGSPLVEKLKLNDRYDLDVCATMTWEQNETVASDDAVDENSPSVTTRQDSIRNFVELAVDVFPPGRLALIPRRILEPAGNLAMSYALGLLLDSFMQGLGKDFERWALDDAYRAERMLLEEELKQELDSVRDCSS
jgi:hypothetical protein